jgi:Fe-S cluster biogenesis protein NfuA
VLLDQERARDRAAEVEARLAQLEALADPGARETATAAIQSLMDFFGAGLARIVALSPEAVSRYAEDELVAHLLMIYGLHPLDVSARVESALESVRPYLAMHGGDVELLSVEDGVARLRLRGSCHGCPSSTATLKQAIEEAIFKVAPDLERVEAEGVIPQAGPLISIDSLVCPIP